MLKRAVCSARWLLAASAYCSTFLHVGLIGWVPNCDTLHALIREYRDVRKIPLNVEHRLMLGMAPDYDHLTVIQKVEVFEHALESTSGAPTHGRCSGPARTAPNMASREAALPTTASLP